MAKYNTLTELAGAFKSGELDGSYMVVMDKGGNSMYLTQSGPEGSEGERERRCQELFQRKYGEPLTELMEIAGIPSEWC